MAEQIISSYGAKFEFLVDKKSVQAVYTQIDAIKAKIESKLNTTLRINKITVAPDALSGAKSRVSKSLSTGIVISKITIQNEAIAKAKKRLETAMKGAFKDASSAGLVFPIDRFKVNAIELRKQVQAAFSSGVILNVNAVRPAARTTSPTSVRPSSGRPHPLSIGQSGLGYGLLAGMTGIVPGVAATAGIMQLNTISEQLQSGIMSLGTITKGRGQETFDWLRNVGKETGLNYREQLPIFSNYLAGSINKQGYEGSLQSFKDISQFGMTHGATTESMKNATRAIGQMWSKGKVMAEELTGQLSEASGFGGSKEIFAAAYQESIGGKLTGQKADAALIDAMKKGNVISEKILPIVSRLMGEKAAGGVAAYQQSTAFQHGQFSNAFSNLVLNLGKGGFDKGMARIFKTLAEAMDSSKDTVTKLGAAFNTLSMAFEGIIKQSTSVINFFTDLGGQFGTILPISLALFKLFGTKGTIFAGLMLALEDLSGYVQGKESVLGTFIQYMTDLTNMDWNAISAGLAIVGVGILAAFSPITALAASIGALIEAYKWLQDLKAKETPIDPTSTRLPTYRELSAENARLADKQWEENPGIGTGWTKLAANVSAPLDALSGYGMFSSMANYRVGASSSEDPATRRVMDKLNAAKASWLSQDDYLLAKAALGSGQKTPESIEAYLTNRSNTYATGNKPFYQDQAPVLQFSGDIILPNVTEPKDFANSLMNFYTGNGTAIK